MKFALLLPVLLVFVSGGEIGLRSYHGYKVIATATTTQAQYNLLKTLLMSDKYDFWTNPKFGGYTDINVSPALYSELTATLTEAGMEWTVKIDDVGKLVEEERAQNDAIIRAGEGRMDWAAYQRWAPTIEPWILSLNDSPVATVSVIGQSYERRNIYMVKVSTGPLPNGDNKKVIFIDSNIHAREWIAGATGSWMLNELVTNYENYQTILDQIDFYFVPYLNIDGYEYCHTNDRMWRKTRSDHPTSTCKGCDPNRNFSFFWGGESTSSNPCSDIYKGESAFSESETVAIRDIINTIKADADIRAYITIHSYGQYWLLSWGYTQGVYPEDYPELLAWGRASIAALQNVHGTRFTTGQGADMLYGVGGASDDYAKSIGIKYSTTAELRDTGSYGFILPPAQIIPTAQETWAAVQVTANTVLAHV